MAFRPLFLLAFILHLAACAAAPAAPSQAPVAAPPSVATPPTLPAASQSASAFSVALYRELARQSGNQFVSPFSVASAFALLYPGAHGATAAEMAATFGFDASPTTAATRIRDLARTLQAPGGSEFTIANAVWVERSFPLEANYVHMVRDELGGTIEPVDFVRAPGATRTRINSWGAQATRDRIPDLLPPDVIRPDTRLILTNAVYFNARWADPFEARSTQQGVFHTTASATVPAQLMHQTTSARYIETSAFQAAAFDYAQGDFELAVFLPRETSSLAAFEAELTAAHLDAWLGELSNATRTRLAVTLPKVQMQTSYGLVAPLQALGLSAVFSDNADLSGVSQTRLAASNVVHRTFLKIDEAGTEAAAATALEMRATAAIVHVAEPIVFRADRPFFIILRHKQSGALLFVGRVVTV